MSSEISIALNKSRQYGTIVPPLRLDCNKTACFEQDGFMFTSDGAIIEEIMDADAIERAMRRLSEERASLAGKAAYEAAMAEQGVTNFAPFKAPEPAAPPRRVTATDVVDNPNELRTEENNALPASLDLKGWADGTVKAQFFAVAKAVREKYGVAVTNKAAVIEVLAQNGIIVTANAA